MKGKITRKELSRHIELVLLEYQDNALLKGMLAAELKLALFQDFGLEVHVNHIHQTLKSMKRIKRKPLDTGDDRFLYIYSVTPKFPA